MDLSSTDTGERELTGPGVCFYCREKIEAHKPDCVTLGRSVVICAVVEYIVRVPRSWTPEEIEFQRNESSWCADADLIRIGEKLSSLELPSAHCACNVSTFQYVREATEKDHKEILDLT